MSDATMLLTARVAAITADIERDRNITLAGIARRIEHDTELLESVWALRGRRCQFCRPMPGRHASRLFYFRKGLANIGANILIVCANHERLMVQRTVQVLAHTEHLLRIRLEDGIHPVSTRLRPDEDSGTAEFSGIPA